MDSVTARATTRSDSVVPRFPPATDCAGRAQTDRWGGTSQESVASTGWKSGWIPTESAGAPTG